MSTSSQQRKTSLPRKPSTRTEWVERWCPPKPLVGLQPIERVLNRHTEVIGPESRLVVRAGSENARQVCHVDGGDNLALQL